MQAPEGRDDGDNSPRVINGVGVIGARGQRGHGRFGGQGSEPFNVQPKVLRVGLGVDELEEDLAGLAVAGGTGVDRGVGQLNRQDFVAEISAEHLDGVIAGGAVGGERVVADEVGAPLPRARVHVYQQGA